MNNQKNVIVLGPPRSGTSLLGKILHDSGVNMGDIRPPDHENPTGYYEDKNLLNIQDRILKYIGCEYNGFNLPERGKIYEATKLFEKEINDYIVKRENEGNNLWGFKTVLSCFTLQAFIPYLSNPYFIVSLRNLDDIAKSQVRYTYNKNNLYKKLNTLEACDVSAQYYCSLFKILKNNKSPIYFVNYDKLLKNSNSEVKKILMFLDLDVKNKKSIAKKIKSPRKIKLLKIKKKLSINSKKSYIKFFILFLKNPIAHYKYVKKVYKNN